jgi:hypothetical protein
MHRRSLRRRFFLDLADEAISFGANCFDQTLPGPIIAYGAPRRVDAGVERRLRNDTSVPNRLEDVVPRDNPVTIANQIFQQIEDLRLERTKHSGAA